MTVPVSAVVGGKLFSGTGFEEGELQIAAGRFAGDVGGAADGEVVDATGC